jgi:4-hydroxy 2-oxovalerate aldolase
MKTIKLLDCTLRDGGYYTNWDFSKEVVEIYFESLNRLPIDYLEVGYRSNPMDGYLGVFFYSPIYVLERIKVLCNKKLVVILNEKDVRADHAKILLAPCVGLIEMVRLAIDPANFSRALSLADAVKELGFEVGFNVMYMSTWKEQKDFLGQIKEVNGIADYFYMVDSFGGVFPEDVKEIYELVRSQADVKIGFHGHNNLELALINSLTAIECGADIIDATITGMGRGAGNLKTELLLTTLNAKYEIGVDFNALSNVITAFESLQKEYGWGTNLPYMVSGANSLPQKDVMEWVTKRFYSFNSIIRALQNQKEGKQDNKKLPVFKASEQFKYALIIGGGATAVTQSEAIIEFLKTTDDICIIHASSKNANPYVNLKLPQYFCLVGSEGHRLEKVFSNLGGFNGKCILPPFPRKMGTYIPDAVLSSTVELESITVTDLNVDSHTVLALQTAWDVGVRKIFLVGYDGYSGDNISYKEQELLFENDAVFSDAVKRGLTIVSLTPTKYKTPEQSSIFSLIF